MRSWKAVTAIAIVTLQAAALAAAPRDWRDSIDLKTEAPADSVTVGQRMHVRYTASYPESLLLLPPGEFDTGASRVLSLEWSEQHGDSGTVKIADLTVLPLDLESAGVPPLPFHFLTPEGDTTTVFSDAVDVPIRHLAKDGETEPRPLKPQWVAPPNYAKYFLIGAAVLLAALAGFLMWKFRRRREAIVPPEPALPPDFVALQALQEIERMNLVDERRFKEHYTLVVDVLRRYLEQRYGVLAMDRTSDEVLLELRARRVVIESLEALLREADLVKFAKFKPGEQAARGALQAAREIIVQTAPRPVATEEAAT